MSKIEHNKTFFQLIAHPLMIPDYQRDYAQGRHNDQKIKDTRTHFIADIILSVLFNRHTHMGLVFGSNNIGLNGFVAVDGQQRLTTCFLFHLYICKQLKERANEELMTRLHNFGWNGRIYASEFTEFLFDTQWNVDSLKNENISQIFQSSKDYFPVWEQDPTVNNMLVMLDEIHSQLKNVSDTELENIQKNLIADSCLLNFDYMKLKDGTDEFQYQKMNSRGRDLTTYELFKQKFFSTYNISDNIKNRLDNEWLLFFDELSSKQFADSSDDNTFEFSEPDIFFQNYINETALWMGIKYCVDEFENYALQIESSKLKNNRTDVGFVNFDAYHPFYEHLDDFSRLIDWFIANYENIENILESFWYTGERTRLMNIFNRADYQSRAINYSIFHYAKKTSFKILNEENFSKWWRPVHNLIANTYIDRSNFSNIIKAIDNLGVDDLLSFLKDNPLTGFSEYQREEEKRKATICLNNPEMVELFNIAEKRNRFRGQIAMLIPDDNILDKNKWEHILKTYEHLVENRYTERNSSDFDFISAMLTFSHEPVDDFNLKYEWGHLRGGKTPARWIHRMIFKYMELNNEDNKLTPQDFFQQCRKVWLDKYDVASYQEKKNKYWIKYILDNYEECKILFLDSDRGRLKYKDGNLWLYLKTYKHDRDILLSNRRKEIIERFPNQENGYVSKHDVVRFYEDYPYLKIVFTSNRIWIGISQDCSVEIPDELPEGIWKSPWYKAWQWLPEEITNNFYEKAGESKEDYIDRLLSHLRSFCDDFTKKLNLYNK